MTPQEQAQIEKWQHTDGGKAELALHALSMSADDLEDSACSREGFAVIRKCRPQLIEARNKINDLLNNL